MKNIIFNLSLLLSILCKLSCTAQNYHRQDPDADKFAGTWKWGNQINGLVLILKKENDVVMFKNDNSTFDILIGFHKIYKNGLMIEDATMYNNTDFIDKKNTINARTETGTNINDPNKLSAVLTHKNKGIRIIIEYLDLNHIKIIGVENIGGTRLILPGQTAPSSAIDIPNNITLTRQ